MRGAGPVRGRIGQPCAARRGGGLGIWRVRGALLGRAAGLGGGGDVKARVVGCEGDNVILLKLSI